MATVNANPTADKVLSWDPTPAGTHYTCIDEGMSRPNTADFVCTSTVNEIELFGFTPTDNGEDITTVSLRVYVGGALAGNPFFHFYIDDGTNIWESSVAQVPSAGIFKEVNEALALDPLTGLPWKFSSFSSYRIGFKSISGDGFDIICIATLQIDITTEVAGNKVIGDGLTNLI
jgi:hypothetical protein